MGEEGDCTPPSARATNTPVFPIRLQTPTPEIKLYTIGTGEMSYEELGKSRRIKNTMKKGSELIGFSQLAASEM